MATIVVVVVNVLKGAEKLDFLERWTGLNL